MPLVRITRIVRIVLPPKKGKGSPNPRNSPGTACRQSQSGANIKGSPARRSTAREVWIECSNISIFTANL